jgi:hypothetical protein
MTDSLAQALACIDYGSTFPLTYRLGCASAREKRRMSTAPVSPSNDRGMAGGRGRAHLTECR